MKFACFWTACNNDNNPAEITVSFSAATEPYTFTYAINGISQTSITTSLNPYVISTKKEGIYTLTSFSDANEIGAVSGSGIVNIKINLITDHILFV